MTERAGSDRPISNQELAVLRAAFAVGAVEPNPERYLLGAEQLRVVGTCHCGCDTVDFRRSDPEAFAGPVADAIGTTPGGGTVGVLVFGTDTEVVSLEVYDWGVADDGIRLPVVESIRSWDSYVPTE